KEQGQGGLRGEEARRSAQIDLGRDRRAVAQCRECRQQQPLASDGPNKGSPVTLSRGLTLAEDAPSRAARLRRIGRNMFDSGLGERPPAIGEPALVRLAAGIKPALTKICLDPRQYCSLQIPIWLTHQCQFYLSHPCPACQKF
ncbi:MAG: hypothetical protein L0Y60_17400, partial [Beijerinckiaceae bacterium]|nr:hypothetical protein [Beijerinckiaceae bacterium]